MTTAIPSAAINLNDEAHWAEQIRLVDEHLEQVEAARHTLRKRGYNGLALRELALTADLLEAARMAWDMTEPMPGQTAAITIEPVSDDERIALRIRIQQALTTAKTSIAKGQEALATL